MTEQELKDMTVGELLEYLKLCPIGPKNSMFHEVVISDHGISMYQHQRGNRYDDVYHKAYGGGLANVARNLTAAKKL